MIRYAIRVALGPRRWVEGIQVGYLAVRYTDRRTHNYETGEVHPPGWVVDHPRSGCFVFPCARTFAEAMIIADDVSRFSSTPELTATTLPNLVRQVGPDIIDWLKTYRPGEFVPFRDWKDPEWRQCGRRVA